MADKYHVKLSDGREFEVTSEGGPPAESDILSSLDSTVPQQPVASQQQQLITQQQTIKPKGELGRSDEPIFNVDTQSISNKIANWSGMHLPPWAQKPAATLGSALTTIPLDIAQSFFGAPEAPALGMASAMKGAIPKPKPVVPEAALSKEAQLGKSLETHPTFANAETPKPPIESVQQQIPTQTPEENVIPRPGNVKPSRDINNIRAEFGSVDQTLRSRPETKPIADAMTRAQDTKMAWIAQTERELSGVSQGLNKADRVKLGDMIDTGNFEGASPELVRRAQKAKLILDDIYQAIPGGPKPVPEGVKDVGYFDNYLTHMESQPDDIKSAIKGVFDYHFGPAHGLLERPELGDESLSSVGKVVYQQGERVPSSPFVEPREGRWHDIERDVNRIFPAYVESVAKVIFDKPMVKQVSAIIDKLPESKLKELAGWSVKNYTRYDALPGLTEAWNSLAGRLSRITSRSLLSFNPGLQTLHVARLVGNMWPELGTKYSTIGLMKVAGSPIESWHEAARLGLLYNEVRPFSFRTPMEKFDSISNFLSAADYLDKAIGYHGFKQKFLDMGMHPNDASMRALSETKRVSLTVDPSRVTKTFASDSPVLGGAVGTLAKQYKQIPTKIVEQYMTIAANAKDNPKAAARLVTGVGALLAARELGGVRTFHLGSNLAPSDLWGAFGSAAKKVVSDLSKGNWQQAVVDTTLWATPGGQSLKRQFEKGYPSVFESDSSPKGGIRFVNEVKPLK